MSYLIDGYNLIFSLIDSKDQLQILRQKIIEYLQKKFSILNLSGMVIFDGAHRRDEESGLSYPSPLIIAYTPKGQSADEYILHRIEHACNPKQITVVTNDRALQMHARSLGSKILPNLEFIDRLKGRSKPKKEKEPKETQYHFDRLLKIFEERLKEP